ncbi:hypothetical protein [Pseudoduganella sp. OTU4001]|uniref:hypothetical protein n=1 Tax=Pseudoduganella sp. OTU4001 TaxID=3043854 RepID=UPI00313E4902
MSEWSLAPKAFVGSLGIEGHSAEVEFTVGLDEAGQAVIEFNPLDVNSQTAFVMTHSNAENGRFSCFKLEGADGEGARFECDNLVLTGLGSQSVLAPGFTEMDEAPFFVSTMTPRAAYSTARITMKAGVPKELCAKELAEQSEPPVVQWQLKGFASHGCLSADCPLGAVTMWGNMENKGQNDLTGTLRVAAASEQTDVEEWRKQTESLCRHVRHVMSFAVSSMLGTPVEEFYHDDMVVMDLLSQSEQQRSEFQVFHHLDLDDIFKCAVVSHFQPAFDVKNITFAIQWFAMRAAYRESRLISSMTVLENLIDSNLPEEDTYILSPKAFEKLRGKLSEKIKELAMGWAEDEASQKAYVKEFNDRLSDLRRRSLMDKILLLAKRWGVELSDIPQEFIQEAKRARDLVVHRGSFEQKKDSTRDLHDHIVTVREVVSRFVLTALGFEGRYISYLGGYHTRVFTKNAPELNYNAGAPSSLTLVTPTKALPD